MIRRSLDPDNNIAINLTMAQECNIAGHYVETPNNYCQPEIITCGGICEGSVVEDAVERNYSWGKSRCEQMCHFPNRGGLHRTSGGAPLETPTLLDPELITRGGILYRFQFQCGVMHISQILHHPNEPRLQQLPTNRYFIIQ